MDLEAIEAIRMLKHRYFRLLDTKRFVELGALLTDDVTTSFQSGELAFTGRDAVVQFLTESLGSPTVISLHNGHHPEITLTGSDSATGTWYLEDRVIVPARHFEIWGTAIYNDEYAKVDGAWKIRHTGYDRIFEEHRRRSSDNVVTFSSRFD
ncbi:MAG TPA: nuclear transport factor 2 family protein [Acidimicrobiales bacterium]|nr:nuclear transport factor 2 family protein [Acidimicrobiales bacterium]